MASLIYFLDVDQTMIDVGVMIDFLQKRGGECSERQLCKAMVRGRRGGGG